MTARELIEEARESINEHDCNDTVDTELSRATTFLDQALSLLPDADESASNWQEFDPKREETWPKEGDYYLVTINSHEVGLPMVDIFRWKGLPFLWNAVLAYQSLPQPYAKP